MSFNDDYKIRDDIANLKRDYKYLLEQFAILKTKYYCELDDLTIKVDKISTVLDQLVVDNLKKK